MSETHASHEMVLRSDLFIIASKNWGIGTQVIYI